MGEVARLRPRCGLLTGAVHAREWGGAEICVNVAADLARRIPWAPGLAYGGETSFTATKSKPLVDGVTSSSSRT